MIFRSNKSMLRTTVIAISFLVGACSSGDSDNSSSNASSTANEAGSTAGNTSSGTADETIGDTTGVNLANGETVPLDAPITWSLGDASYSGLGEVSGAQQNIAGRAIVSISTNDEDAGNGEFNGSRLFLHLTQGGSGDYTVVDNFSIETITGSGTNVAYVIVSAGTETGDLAETDWESVTGVVSVVVDNNGSYHVSTIEPLTLTRASDQNGGIPNSPDQISFEMQNIHGMVF